MNLSFLRFFKRDKGGEGGVAVAPPPAPTFAKPASERFGKTFTPNSARIVGLEPMRNFPSTTPIAAATPLNAAPVPNAPRKISLGGNGAISISKVAAPETATAPASERTIALSLADLVPHIPSGLLQPAEIDPQRRVLLKASEVERGMASGRPTVPLRSVYQQAPEFFTTEVDAADQTEVALPFGKVLEQFASFQLRQDQVSVEAVPELDTPFLKMTQEDNKRLGTSSTPLPAPEISAPLASAGAEATETKPPAPIRLSLPRVAAASPKQEPSNPASLPTPVSLPPAPAPVTAKISPNGTGVPASERVPASCGPSVPTPMPALAAPTTGRIPFKVDPPSNDLRAADAPKVHSLRSAEEALEFSAAAPRIRLPLRNVLRGIPPFLLTGPIDQVPEDAVIEFPFSIVEPQLALGRVSLSPAQFLTALPEKFRGLIKLEDAETPVGLPLQEVLQNLPNESLQLRGDQVEVEVAELFETPFSLKAAEDAERLKVTATPVTKPAVVIPDPVAEDAVVARVAEPAKSEPAAAPALRIASAVTLPVLPPKAAPIPALKPGERSALQVVFDTDDTLDPKTVVAHASKLPGVSACAIVFSDGLSLAGNIPAGYEAEALCGMAPVIMKRIGDQMAGANLGALNGITVYCAKTPVSFFAHGNICLAALHSAGDLAAEIRTRLISVVQELARTYAQPA